MFAGSTTSRTLVISNLSDSSISAGRIVLGRSAFDDKRFDVEELALLPVLEGGLVGT